MSTIRKIFGDRLINILKSVEPLYIAYYWYRNKIYNRIFGKSAKKAYTNWIKHIEPNLWCEILPLIKQPKISIIVPVYNPPIKFLQECVNSVISQTYSNWEMVIVDDASTCPVVKKYLSELSGMEHRVLVVFSDINQHISKTTNLGITEATGEYIAFLDHDDVLSPHALNETASVFVTNKSIQWVYSDEDFIGLDGKRTSPHFKSDWNLFLLRSHNYITHFCAYETRFLRKLGGCREGAEGAQDYDLALRAANELCDDQIGHVSKILYHWRIHPESTSMSSNAKSYTVEAGRKALKEHLDSAKISYKLDSTAVDNFYHVKYMPSIESTASIIIPTRNQYDLLKACVDSIISKTSFKKYEIIIVDNQTDCAQTLAYLSSLSKTSNVKVLGYNKPFNYSEINNFAVKHATGDVVVLLNNDTEVISAEWLTDMVGLAVLPEVGCVGAKLLYEDNSIQHAGVIMGLGGYAAHSHRGMNNAHPGYFYRPHINQQLSAVTAACLAVKKELYDLVDGLDEAFCVAYNDVDFCLRVEKQGYKNVYCATAELFHYESKSRGLDISLEKQKRFDQEKALLESRWSTVIDCDPFYNVHLTRSREDFSFRYL
ncbi:glycosyltransferase family 2 protein [Shewanella goraebulensis]|uniref:glycosyltransferase family 2 protein n=1 Tax=Shewanella goraebulensis TaxID=3050637 RepID=UPI00254E3DB7|nr:glycosyltransferase family 2 protein [Shewanella goraebulensis]